MKHSYFIKENYKIVICVKSAIALQLSIIHFYTMELDKKDVSKKVGIKIRELRLSKGLTIEQLAFDAGMEYTQLSRIELGKINTSIYHVYKISNSLSVTVPEIFNVLDEK